VRPSTAATVLKYLAREGLVDTRLATFYVPRHPQPVDVADVREAFECLAEVAGARRGEVRFSTNFGLEVSCSDRMFEKLFKVIFVQQQIFPRQQVEGSWGQDPFLPTLFVEREKTQVRQVPLVDRRPWPFKFLLELGGMVVFKTEDHRGLLTELRQFLNNHPQYDIRVDAKEGPDGTVVVFTWWFQEVPRGKRRGHVNVPDRVRGEGG